MAKKSSAKKTKPPSPSTNPNRSPSLSPPPPFTFTTTKKASPPPLTHHRYKQAECSPVVQKQVGSISELKEMTAVKVDGIKRHLERSHLEIVKEIESSQSRLHKRFKIQAQACQQAMDEAEKEYKKMSERINESKESLKASYAELVAEAQASTSRVCKTSLPDLSQSFEKALDALRARYGASSAM